jgi:uncharacterized membrane protein
MIVVQDSVRVNVSPDSAYPHLLRFSEYPKFMSGVLGCTPVDDNAAHLTLDVGGCRLELDAVIADACSGWFVRWDSAALIESFWLEETPERRTNVVAVAQLHPQSVRLFDATPEAVMRTRLRMDLKGFKRLCEESQ